LISTNNGGGALGDWIAHENEAPFSEKLPEWFILSLCPPGGTVLDPFSGSGTTAKVAKQHGRRGIGTDIRTSQCQLTARRVSSVQKAMF
jgi:site-specific DNA-methyltransferase (adenine-specific)